MISIVYAFQRSTQETFDVSREDVGEEEEEADKESAVEVGR